MRDHKLDAKIALREQYGLRMARDSRQDAVIALNEFKHFIHTDPKRKLRQYLNNN